MVARTVVTLSVALSFVVGTGCGGACPDQDEVFLLAMPSATTQVLIDACRDSARMDCLPLCQRVLGSSPFPTAIHHCELLPDQANGYTAVHVRWGSACE
ncbi:MAG TPA: hypothetical protein VNO55_21865 [Polyangia bacterium]|nr:hypothetical protein [Polyangia bacterium]